MVFWPVAKLFAPTRILYREVSYNEGILYRESTVAQTVWN